MVSEVAPAHKRNGDDSQRPISTVSHDGNAFNVMTFVPAVKENESSLTMCGKHIPKDFLEVMPEIKEALLKDFEPGSYKRLPSRVQNHLQKLAKL